jgi:hypothetical protein
MKHFKVSLGLLSIVILVSSCGGDKQSTSREISIDTTKVIKGQVLGGLTQDFGFEWLRKNNSVSNQITVLAQVDPTTANSRTSLHTMRLDSLESKGYADNPEELVGTIIEINDLTNPSNFRLLRNIVYDSVDLKTKVATPKYSDIVRKQYNQSNVNEISWLGIGAKLEKNQIYKFEQTDIGILTVPTKQLDTLKIREKYKCRNSTTCKYYVVTQAVIDRVEVRQFTERTKKLDVGEFSAVAQAFGISGKLYTSSLTDEYRLNYVVYIHFRDIQSILD